MSKFADGKLYAPLITVLSYPKLYSEFGTRLFFFSSNLKKIILRNINSLDVYFFLSHLAKFHKSVFVLLQSFHTSFFFSTISCLPIRCVLLFLSPRPIGPFFGLSHYVHSYPIFYSTHQFSSCYFTYWFASKLINEIYVIILLHSSNFLPSCMLFFLWRLTIYKPTFFPRDQQNHTNHDQCFLVNSPKN